MTSERSAMRMQPCVGPSVMASKATCKASSAPSQPSGPPKTINRINPALLEQGGLDISKENPANKAGFAGGGGGEVTGWMQPKAWVRGSDMDGCETKDMIGACTISIERLAFKR